MSSKRSLVNPYSWSPILFALRVPIEEESVSDEMAMRLTWGKRLKRIVFSHLVEKLFLQGTKSRVTRLSAKFIFSTYEKHPDARLFHSREHLWKSFGETLGASEWVGFEFGVASGDATKTFMRMPYSRNCLQWNGFDTFYGLPSAWGDLPQGAFSTNGKTPKVKNKIVKWHIGLIEDTRSIIPKLKNLDKNFVIIFDFDLYSATKAAWDAISKFLKPGDIIYFDEAYEKDEERIIHEIYSSNLSLKILGFTAMGIAFQVI